MDFSKGLLKIRVKRGIKLVVKDHVSNSSDPFVVITSGNQKVKTRAIRHTCNPEWNEDLSIGITHPSSPIKLTVYDKDRFSKPDKMGEADIDIGPYLEAMSMGLDQLPIGTAVKKVQPAPDNCLADECKVVWTGEGTSKMVYDMILQLQKVEKGQVVVQLDWVDLSEIPDFAPTRA